MVSVVDATEQHSNAVHSHASQAAGKIVAIDDDSMTLRLLRSQLRDIGHPLETAENPVQGLEQIDDDTLVALIDLRMPELDGFHVLRHIREHHPRVQVIILTGSHDTADAVEAMRAGAFQYITKPCEPKQLQVFVRKAIEAWRAANENQELKASKSQNVPVQSFPGKGAVSNLLSEQIRRISPLESTVFIGGESGTGKSTIARLIHQQSKRKKGPFVSINCASLPRDLLTSELFGHTKGAFTGADRDRVGHAEVAEHGTLFLDEIGDLPLELQPKLLTFLQDRTIRRLGSTKVRKVDVRLIVATHRDLAAMCRENAFRQDLYFRLMVLQLELPPLRLRKSELPEMALGLLERICRRMEISQRRISDDAMQLLLDHSWRGNIRELENTLERAAAFCNGDIIGPGDLKVNYEVLDRRQTSPVEPSSSPATNGNPLANPPMTYDRSYVASAGLLREQPDAGFLNPEYPEAQANVSEFGSREEQSAMTLAGKTLEEIERMAIVQTLQAQRGNKAKSARVLGISEKSIYNKMRRLGIDWSKLSFSK